MAADELADALLARAVQPPETVTLGRLGSLLQGLADIIAERASDEVTLRQLRTLLVREGLSALPVSAAVDLLEAVAPVAHHPDVAGKLTVRQFELLLDDIAI
jgi:hypothetical protein